MSSLNPLACDGPAHGRSLSTLSGLSRKLRTKSDEKILGRDKEPAGHMRESGMGWQGESRPRDVFISWQHDCVWRPI